MVAVARIGAGKARVFCPGTVRCPLTFPRSSPLGAALSSYCPLRGQEAGQALPLGPKSGKTNYCTEQTRRTFRQSRDCADPRLCYGAYDSAVCILTALRFGGRSGGLTRPSVAPAAAHRTPGMHPGLVWLREYNTYCRLKEQGPLSNTSSFVLSLFCEILNFPVDIVRLGSPESGLLWTSTVTQVCFPIP